MEQWNDGIVVNDRISAIFDFIVKTIAAIDPTLQYSKTNFFVP